MFTDMVLVNVIKQVIRLCSTIDLLQQFDIQKFVVTFYNNPSRNKQVRNENYELNLISPINVDVHVIMQDWQTNISII